MQKADRGRIKFLQVFLRAVQLFSRLEYLDIISLKMGDFFGLKKVIYLTLLHLPPLRFHCVGEWWILDHVKI